MLALIRSRRCTANGCSSVDSSGWQQPQDTAMALVAPDEYAWRLFVALSWPARTDEREADTSKKLGDDGRLVWESWKLVSGGPKKSEVYRAAGADPTPWSAPLDPYCDASARDIAPLQNLFRQTRKISLLFEPLVAQPGTDEVRMNLETFTFIAANGLFAVEGQEAMFAAGARTTKFPASAKEVKAQWREIADADAKRYHSCRYGGKLYGLTALHILTKDLPNWFWATFEHVDNKKPENMNKEGYGPWLLASRDAFSCPASKLDCEAAPKAIGLEGTKWENYRLRGSQIDFVDSTGNPTRLANSQIETDFQTTSSCISCHARASVGPRIGSSKLANRLSIFESPFATTQILTPYGPPSAEMFATSTGGTALPPTQIVRYTQLDFVWSLMRAQRREP
jgi:hypothetical protein